MSVPIPPLMDIVLTDAITVDLVQSSASDESVVWSARVSTLGQMAEDYGDESRDRGLINYLIRDRHGSPLEHNMFTFRTHAPIFVWREHMRHRIASYNEESGRYRELEPVFYCPSPERALVQVGKAGEYRFEAGTDEQYALVHESIRRTSAEGYQRYRDLLHAGVAREVARMVLPLNIYSTAYVTMNARSLMNFLSLRRHVDGSTFPSYPQREIEMVAEQYEEHFARLMPVTHEAWVRHGRVAP